MKQEHEYPDAVWCCMWSQWMYFCMINTVCVVTMTIIVNERRTNSCPSVCNSPSVCNFEKKSPSVCNFSASCAEVQQSNCNCWDASHCVIQIFPWSIYMVVVVNKLEAKSKKHDCILLIFRTNLLCFSSTHFLALLSGAFMDGSQEH